MWHEIDFWYLTYALRPNWTERSLPWIEMVRRQRKRADASSDRPGRQMNRNATWLVEMGGHQQWHKGRTHLKKELRTPTANCLGQKWETNTKKWEAGWKPDYKHPGWETNKRKWEINARKWEISELGTGPQASKPGGQMKRTGKQMRGSGRQAGREPDHKHRAWPQASSQERSGR